ncbi:MAG TPA: GNAT family N-acetyltransferase [Thermoanaerobaculia bacterium]|jgi:ribosomal protein S18 acetylase RimI-like enzyme|nr:GNAT family N-acetyltransferase [Thermoanaerobaculia bacterium]
MNVRPMRRDDLEAVVAIHRAAFPNFFLTFLGPRFLRVFYGAVMRDGIALVAIVNGRVAGFVAGMLDSKSFYRRLWRKRFIQVAFALTPVLLRHPSTLKKVARRGVARAFQPTPGAELMSLAVHPREQHHGLGRALVEAFIAFVKASGTENLWLITDAADNDAVKHFYETLGFTVRREFTNAEGRALVEYAR